ncbi:hypothetical protein [Amycolatopsis sp. NPDC059021]|uniref:hypothetical protein n=1 Tax=Amycolatopsis sp. NPDC059021 TaxID=3346704 RepID=UPI00366F28E2
MGVDIQPQPNYAGDEFIQGEAVALAPVLVSHFRPAAVVGSPPCQAFSNLNAYNQLSYPNLIPALRARFEETGLPYVIENVPGAKEWLTDPVTICGGSLGLPLIRHRLFETGGGFTLAPPAHRPHQRCVRNGSLPTAKAPWMSIHGGKHSRAWLEAAKKAMGMPWVSKDTATGIREVCEAAPPAYGEHIGRQLMTHLQRSAVIDTTGRHPDTVHLSRFLAFDHPTDGRTLRGFPLVPRRGRLGDRHAGRRPRADRRAAPRGGDLIVTGSDDVDALSAGFSSCQSR